MTAKTRKRRVGRLIKSPKTLAENQCSNISLAQINYFNVFTFVSVIAADVMILTESSHEIKISSMKEFQKKNQLTRRDCGPSE